MRVKEVCSCPAEIEVDVDLSAQAESLLRLWRENHKHEIPPPAQVVGALGSFPFPGWSMGDGMTGFTIVPPDEEEDEGPPRPDDPAAMQ